MKAEARFGLYLYVKPGADRATASTVDTSGGADTLARGKNADAESIGSAGTLTPGERPNMRGPLTIGDVDPVNLDPDGLAGRKPIYAAGVPARGGLKTATQKQLPDVPALDLSSRNRVVLRVSPLVAARILEEEKHYVENPADRPEVHVAREDFPANGPRFEGAATSTNWGLIAAFVAFVGYFAVLMVQTLG